MRELTEEEFKLAPNWATHYNVFDESRCRIVFSCHERFQILNSDGSLFDEGFIEEGFDSCLEGTDVEIPKFNKTDHGLSDSDICKIEVIDGNLRLYLMSNDISYIECTRDDSISIAKHFGLTSEDLK